MGKLSQAVKDRKCNICGESRQRNARQLKAHYVRCLAALKAFTADGGEQVHGVEFLGSPQYKELRANERDTTR